MDDGYVWGGALAGLVCIGLIGVYLAQTSGRIRAALTPYVGEPPARWTVYAVWFAYVYSTLNAVGQALSVLPAFASEGRFPPALSFAYGTVWHALLTFLSYLLPVAQFMALIVVAVLLHRHLKADPA